LAPLQVAIQRAKITNVEQEVRTVLCDLDGVIWLAHQPIPGSVDAVAALRNHGIEVLFVTNNSTTASTAVEEILGSLGIAADGAVLGSAQAAAQMLSPRDRVLICGEQGIRDAVVAVGAQIVDSADRDAIGTCDVVVVGLDRNFTYRTLDRAAAEIRNGARFIATNDDATYPTPHGPVPGAGSLVAAVAVACGVQPVLAGKPHQPMADLVLARTDSRPDQILMVGDRLSTDGLFARTLGAGFAWVRSGVDGDLDDPSEVPLRLMGADLAEVVRAVLSSSVSLR
jgi:HAD superfamily hydrolase (TIGR01450 family)